MYRVTIKTPVVFITAQKRQKYALLVLCWGIRRWLVDSLTNVMQKSISIMIVFFRVSCCKKIHLYSPQTTPFTIIGNCKATNSVALLTGRIVLNSTTMAAVITNLDMTTHTQLCFELLTMSHLKGLTVKVKNVMSLISDFFHISANQIQDGVTLWLKCHDTLFYKIISVLSIIVSLINGQRWCESFFVHVDPENFPTKLVNEEM